MGNEPYSRWNTGMEITFSGHRIATRSFGPVEYRAVAIPADENKEQ